MNRPAFARGFVAGIIAALMAVTVAQYTGPSPAAAAAINYDARIVRALERIARSVERMDRGAR